MRFDETDLEDMLVKLERVAERLEELKEERKKLLKANRQLVRLAETTQDILGEVDEEAKKEAEKNFMIDEHEYSFQEGWKPKEVVYEKSLDLEPGIDLDDVDRQLEQVKLLMDRIRTYKNEDEG